MTDAFSLLGQPRRPWLEEPALHAAFLERSRQCHPDRVHEAGEKERGEAHDRHVALNTAYQQLREHRSRLAHLIRLETGRAPADVQEIPHQTTDLFLRVGQACWEADQFLRAHAGHTSPILKAQRLVKAQPLRVRVGEVLNALEAWEADLVGQLRALDGGWDGDVEGRAGALRTLEQLYRLLSYQDRWTRQVRERLFLLSTP